MKQLERRRMRIFHITSIIVCYFTKEHIVNAKQNILGKVEFGKNATIFWSYDLSEPAVIIPLTIKLRFDNRVVSTCTVEIDGHSCNPTSIEKYDAMIDLATHRIHLKVINLTYEDSGDYLGEIIYKKKKKPKTMHLNDTALQVRGAPLQCDNTFMTSYEFPQYKFQPMINITVCGYPRPKYHWKFGEDKQLAYLEKVTKNNKYTFSVLLPNLTSSMCGTNLTFQAFNSYGKLFTSSTINVSFPLNAVKGFTFNQDGNCRTFKWNIVDGGSCGVFYNIQTLDANLRILGTLTTQPWAESLSVCYAKYTQKNITARIRAVYKDQYGTWSHAMQTKRYSETYPNKTALTVGLLCGGCVLVLLLVLLLCYVKRERRKNGNEIWKPKKSQSIDKTQFVDVSLLNMKSNPPEPYTELSDHRRQTYTPLHGHESLYENMDEVNQESIVNEYEVPNVADVSEHRL